MTEPSPLDLLRRSVTRDDPYQDGIPGISYPFAFLQTLAGAIPGWGTDINARDAMLANFFETESIAAAAVGTIIARNAAMSWELKANSDTLRTATFDMLMRSNMGRGWEDLMMSIGIDWETQDKGAFVEVIREGDSPEAPIMGFQSLAARDCWSTGRLDEPVIFRDKAGKFHRLKWYQVHHLREMPRAHPIYSALQFSALSRFLEQAQIHKNISQYLKEKTGGRNTRAIYIVNNVQQSQIAAAMKQIQIEADNRNLVHFLPPVIITTLSDERAPEVAAIEMAGLPDGFSQKEDLQNYLTVLAMALLCDFQELAPLPAGNIGTGTQSETLDEKSRQKGSALWRKAISTMMANLLPDGVEFTYTETDVDEEQKNALASKTRGEARKMMVDTGELDAEGARSLAVEQGDIPEEIADEVAERTANDEEPEEEDFLFGPAPPQQEGDVPPEQVAASNDETKALPAPAERMELEGESEQRVDAALQKVFRRVRQQLRRSQP